MSNPEYLPQMATFLTGYVHNIIDVDDDGNCGYRSIAALLGEGQDSWPKVREAMIHELTSRSHLYTKLYNSKLTYDSILRSLTLAPKEIATREKWFDLPDMGHIVATAFQVILISFSVHGGCTYFPLTGAVPHEMNHKVVCLLHVNNNHWVQV